MREKIFNILPFLILVLGFSATIIMWRNYEKVDATRKQLRFESITRQIETGIKDRLATYADAHYAGAGLFLGSNDVTREDWHEFVETINLLGRYPGIHGIGYAVQINRSDSAEFHKDIILIYGKEFKIKSYDKYKDTNNLFMIKYIEPFERNHIAIAFDMGSEKKRRFAMETARDNSLPTISQKVTLVQDTSNSPGFLLYVPFYKKNYKPTSVIENRQNFHGWIYSPFVMKDFMNSLLDMSLLEIKSLVNIEIYDGNLRTEETLLYRKSADSNIQTNSNKLSQYSELQLFNHKWAIEISPTEAYLNQYTSAQPTIVLFAGILLSGSLFYIAFLLARQRRQAMLLVDSKTVELREKNYELEEKNRDLQRSNRDLEQFAYVASHDLKEPLRMVKAYMQLLSKRYREKLDEDAQTFIDFAVEGSERMDSLIGDLLNYSKVGRIGAELEKIDIENIVKSVIKANEIQLEESGAQIIYNNLPELNASPGYLFSLFQNLINNAVKFRQNNKPLLIIIAAEKKENEWVFSVKDNGIGIEKEHLERIFVIFHRLHARNAYSGTGIGLAICKKIVEFHGGNIWAESKFGEGTTIYFTLPA